MLAFVQGQSDLSEIITDEIITFHYFNKVFLIMHKYSLISN